MGDKNVRKKKPPKYPSWIGALTAFLAASALLTAGACAGIYWLLDATFGRTPQDEATLTAVTSLTDMHGEEARAALEGYYAISGSLYTQLHPEAAAQILTGRALEQRFEFEIPDGDDTVYVTPAITLAEVHVLEYSDTQLKVIGCGTLDIDVVNLDGELVQELPEFYFNVLFVFIREDGTWKFATGIGIDRDNINHIWPYVSDEEREVIGDFPSYVDLYPGCRIDY